MNGHLRGRVEVMHYVRNRRTGERRPVYRWSVVNETTGLVVAQDNSCRPTLGDACDEAARLVDLCREVHRREIRLKTLRESA